MAATCLTTRPSSSSPFITIPNTRASAAPPKRVVSWRSPSLCRSIQLRRRKMPAPASTIMAGVDGEPVVADEEEGLDEFNHSYDYYTQNDSASGRDWKNRTGPCELYVCNLPRRFDIPDLMEMFKPFGTIFSIEISRNLDTRVSRGSGYVTIESIEAAKAAITALDGTDVGGREMRVKFSIHMNPKRRNSEALNSVPLKILIYESPHKLYVGNLAWSVEPAGLRNHFSRFGNVTSARVLHDRKGGKIRAYGFLSFSSASERDAAKSLNGEEFYGRKMVVREGTEKGLGFLI